MPLYQSERVVNIVEVLTVRPRTEESDPLECHVFAMFSREYMYLVIITFICSDKLHYHKIVG